MRNKIYCDYCQNLINDDYDEISFLHLEIGCDTFLFCDEDCLSKYIDECTLEKYVDFEGNIN